MKTNYLSQAAMFLLLLGCSEGSAEIPDNPNTNTKQEESQQSGPDTPDGFELEIIDAPHYLLRFIAPESFSAGTIYGEPLTLQVRISSSAPREYAAYYDAQNPDERPQKAAAYKALCERYGDTGYSGIREFFPLYTGGFDALWHNLVSIDVTSTADYDAGHPAGTSLNDLCELISWTPRDYLESGYTDRYDWSAPPAYIPEKYRHITFYYNGQVNDGLHPFRIPLSECTAEDLLLMGSGQLEDGPLFLLRFAHAPEAGNSLQQFELKLTDERGGTYTVRTDVCKW